MSKSFLDKIKLFPIIPVFNHEDKHVTENVLSACYKSGMRAFEFTNRGTHSVDVFKYIISNRFKFPDMSIGIGSIMNTAQAQEYVKIGADFVVAPYLDLWVGSYCIKAGKPWIPGCGTLTEIISAQKAGADLIKLFPGGVLGPEFVKSVLGPCPDLKLMPTGGVAPTKVNLESWFNAGVFSIGMGSKLFDKEVIKPENQDVLINKISQLKPILAGLNS